MALIPKEFPSTTVAIGISNPNNTYQWIGTGFLYGKLLSINGDQSTYKVFLVTNKHVLDNFRKITVRFDIASGGTQTIDVELYTPQNEKIWIEHQDAGIDVAVIPINPNVLNSIGVKYHFFKSNVDALLLSNPIANNLSEGDFIYSLGFPMGLVGMNENAAITRSGILSRIRECRSRITKSFLIDANIFPGNSGGPVILKPEMIHINGTTAIAQAYLIGVIAGYHFCAQNVAQAGTTESNVTFRENSGIGYAFPVDYIEETISQHLNSLSPTHEAAVNRTPSGTN